MTQDQIQDLMLVYAADMAEADERAEAERLLAGGDVVAQSAYAEALAVVASIPLSLDPVEPPRSVRDSLLLRVAADVSNDPGARRSAVAPARRRGPVLATWAAGGLAACLALALTLVLAQNRQMQQQLAKTTQLDQGIRNVVSSPHVQLAKLTFENQSDGPGKPGGRVMWCPVSKQYQLIVYRLSPPPAGRVYKLWLITPDQKKLEGGTFSVDERGNATVYARAPRDVKVTHAAVTDEPETGAAQPTGAMHLIGELH